MTACDQPATEDIEPALRELALAAGRAIIEVRARTDLGARSKADASPITEADIAADRLITEGLMRRFPAIQAVTEENPASHRRAGLQRFFLVDPLDGTREFVRREGEFTVNIALVEDGVPVAGVVYAPAVGRLFRTRSGAALEERVDADGRPLTGSERAIRVATPDNDALVVVASKSHRDPVTDAYIARYRVARFTGAGSSLKFCLIAAGEADFYPRLGRTMEWDTAAGHAVLRAAGGQVVRFDDHRPLAYGKPGYENPFFLALACGVDLVPATVASRP